MDSSNFMRGRVIDNVDEAAEELMVGDVMFLDHQKVKSIKLH